MSPQHPYLQTAIYVELTVCKQLYFQILVYRTYETESAYFPASASSSRSRRIVIQSELNNYPLPEHGYISQHYIHLYLEGFFGGLDQIYIYMIYI